MKIIGDYHTHTIYSHGSGSIRDNVLAAREKGLEEIAICDHGPGHKLYGVSKEKLYEMRSEIDNLNREFDDINILLGLEANVMSYGGDIDVDKEILDLLDILLLGYHYGIVPKTFKDAFRFYLVNNISKVIKPLEKGIIEANTDALIKAIDRYPISLITHPGSKARLNIKRLADKCEEKEVCLEVNSKHGQLDVEGLESLRDSKVMFMVSSDAHSRDRVGDLEKGIDRLKIAKISIDRVKTSYKGDYYGICNNNRNVWSWQKSSNEGLGRYGLLLYGQPTTSTTGKLCRTFPKL